MLQLSAGHPPLVLTMHQKMHQPPMKPPFTCCQCNHIKEDARRQGGGHPMVRASHCQPPPSCCVVRRQITLHCNLCPTPLVHPLVLLLHQLVSACHIASVAGIFAIIAPKPMPSLHCCNCCCYTAIFANRCRRHCCCPLPLPPANAAVNHHHHPPPLQLNAMSLLPLPCRSQLPPLNAAMLQPPSNAPPHCYH